ncbi:MULTISPECIES: tRNA uridine 5-oxyacetic acid(34) methyltransferase CmoM [unclassified Vibrio]|uniref:tRNA uridine 5-oxyacetic acid(34) methyltransferase CmoM n=1 Tax=unclassified Vibrio TaxID=2614977 RepID=UPI001361E62C|nr:tRNA uridine 5-oxyacetic acid(34) methyltransferase CmoM [Vibrio sp. V36_P2S2PM302]NAX21144.1 tRNA uridine 5-oxyacetic acid(34) methyltransferase CmoM [Vibrio sp. V39_P1S14PM300]NAX23891.1 tRNA uridine 5-oxyacetic acid(34) methyltransferase CmoM [Vibrio sp. V38_P2S17PM301]NAX32580.1 tRNA uridine 5-oxyacetic acid(34) methyltransferase CmoM [Vibrio sp. V37_P2S8PM304]
MTQDRNFDDIAHKFAKNIYGSDKGEIRQIIVWEDLLNLLSQFSQPSLHVLDAGGGLAQMSQKLAKLGHRITLCDLSCEMLQLAEQDIANNGLLEQYRLIHSPVQSIDEHLDEPVDVVMFHAVMEWLADPKSALDKVLAQVRPGGMASVMFYNHHGLVFKNAICGNIPHVLKGMPHRKRFKLQPQQGLKPEEVYQWMEDAGFDICGKSGIRSFSDYIGNMKNMGDYEFDDVLALEKQLCRQEPYLSLGRYIHVWAKKKQEQEQQ